MHVRAQHSPAASPSSASAQTTQAEKYKRPTISGGGSNEDWAYFKTRWDEYSKATNLGASDRVLQLLECCDEQLRRDLTRAAGGTLTTKSEADALDVIRSLAIREENAMVARFSLHNMHQDAEEPIRVFGARIKGQAGVCKSNLACPRCHECSGMFLCRASTIMKFNWTSSGTKTRT